MKNFQKFPPEFRNGYKDKKRLEAIAQMGCIVCENEGIDQIDHLEIHHFIGCGLGLKASDLLSIPLCWTHHQKYKDSKDVKLKKLSIHGLTKEFEKKFGTQEMLLKQVNEKLGVTEQYEEYFRIIETKNNQSFFLHV